jgi:hypothetical protein
MYCKKTCIATSAHTYIHIAEKSMDVLQKYALKKIGIPDIHTYIHTYIHIAEKAMDVLQKDVLSNIGIPDIIVTLPPQVERTSLEEASVHVHTCIYIYIYTCMHACMYTYVYILMIFIVCVYIYIVITLPTHVERTSLEEASVHIHTCIYTYMHICVCVYNDYFYCDIYIYIVSLFCHHKSRTQILKKHR